MERVNEKKQAMGKIVLKSPYKIIESRYKQYIKHYEIPSAEALIIPVKTYGDQIVCDVVYKDPEGEIAQKSNLMFAASNLEPVDAIKDFDLHTIWENFSKVEHPVWSF